MTHLILVVEEDPATRSFLAYNLTSDGYEVVVAEDRRHVLGLLAARRPQLVLVDINGHSLGLLDAVRQGDGLAGEVDPETPIIVLTARADELSRVRVFDRGGDDVVSKPFSYPELRGRVRALLRRSYEPRHAPVARVGTVTVDHRTREVRVGERRVALAAKEFALLQTLIADPTRVFTKHELLRDVWGYRGETRSRTLDSHAARLRRKLDAAGAGRRTVICVWGVGYRFCDEPPVGPSA
jgi:DNA-binding response OmpR family regulator